MNDDIYLSLGCYGRKENGFTLCPSTNNNILCISEDFESYIDIIKYLNVVKLFDRPMLDQNAIRHFLFNLQNKYDLKTKRLWTDHQFNLLERFMLMHKPCGFYVKLTLDNQEIEEEPVSIFIKSSKIKEREELEKTKNVRNRIF